MSLFEFLFTTLAGFTFLFIAFSTLGVIFYGSYVSIQLNIRKKPAIKKTNVDSLIVLGIIVLVSGILNQIAGMIEALEIMISNTEVAPQNIMEGIIESFKVPVFCAFVFIFSLTLWYFNKRKWESLNADPSAGK